MKWLTDFAAAQPIAYAVLILASVAVVGLGIGRIKIRGIRLGVAGVLFAGILFGHFHLTINPETLGFVREAGLILFVYTIGNQVGPGFFTSLRRQGLPLNLLAGGIILAGALLTIASSRFLHIDMAAAVGIFSGATTNTPALGATQEALRQMPALDSARSSLPALGYAAAYPFGIIGIILAMVIVRRLSRIDPIQEARAFALEQEAGSEPLQRMNICVRNPNLVGLKLHEIPGKDTLGIIISRIKYAGETEASAANAETTLHAGDIFLAVGTAENLRELCLIVGAESREDLRETPGPVTLERFVVTRDNVLGKTIRALNLTQKYGVTVTRVTRADIEMTAVPALKLQFGDVLQLVGKEADIAKVASVLGNSLKDLNRTNFLPIFLGIGLGILLGLYPLSFANMPTPVRLGLAGGPLIAAILLSRIGRIGSLIWYMPPNANLTLRELGITLFLACAGLKAGEHFFEVLLTTQGLVWMTCGAVITLVPLLLAAWIGRFFMKLNFINLCGLLSGSMTDPPALAFANAINNSDAPSVAYATVYPLTMLLRIFVAQLLVVIFVR
ncbi:MAG: putative transporter [Chthoniobacter sp.]|uniref:putative transporter n=1 Tax=Chthoniobacter sp. TaxID=2510640 RepID=UPI0032A7D353